MSKALEALQSYVQSNEPVYPSDKAYQLIKSALKRKEKLEEFVNTLKEFGITTDDILSKLIGFIPNKKIDLLKEMLEEK